MLSVGGCAPHAPIPEEHALRAALAHPPALGASFCGGCAPTPPPGWQRNRGAEGGRVSSMGGCAPHAPIAEEHALRAALAHPPALGVSFCGGCAPTPPTGWQRPRGPEAERVLSVGGCAPHAPIPEEHALRAALAHPPALGASFCGGCAPTPPPGWQRNRGAEGGRVSSMGGCAPHAPIAEEHALRAALAHPPALGVSFCGGCAPTPPTGWQRPRGPEAERVSSVGGAAPHAPIPEEHALRAALARPPALGVSFCGGCAPTPPPGWQRNRGPEGERVSSMGGCAPHAPIPEEHALRAALAHPPALGVSFCGGCAPTPPPDRQRNRGPEGGRASSMGGRVPTRSGFAARSHSRARTHGRAAAALRAARRPVLSRWLKRLARLRGRGGAAPT